MLTWRAVTTAEERHKDRLRRSEKARFIQEITAQTETSSIWQKMKQFVGDKGQQKADTGTMLPNTVPNSQAEL